MVFAPAAISSNHVTARHRIFQDIGSWQNGAAEWDRPLG